MHTQGRCPHLGHTEGEAHTHGVCPQLGHTSGAVPHSHGDFPHSEHTAGTGGSGMAAGSTRKPESRSIEYSAADDCDSAPACTLGVSSNEGSSSDWLVMDAHDVALRVERTGNSDARIYTISVTCTDQPGLTSNAAVTVTVPHDRGQVRAWPRPQLETLMPALAEPTSGVESLSVALTVMVCEPFPNEAVFSWKV